MLVREDTCQRNPTWTGPVTTVSSQVSWLDAMGPLRAASVPSNVFVVWWRHGASPPVVQARSQRSTASHSVPAMAKDTGRAWTRPVRWFEKTTASVKSPIGRSLALALRPTVTATLSPPASVQLAGTTDTQFPVAVAEKETLPAPLFVTT